VLLPRGGDHPGHHSGMAAKEGIDILYGVDAATRAIVEFIEKSKHSYNVYADSKTPSFVMNNDNIRAKFFEFKNKKHGYIRYITEVTKENIDYCKQLMKAVDLRHIEGPRGVFRVNETEYHYNAVLDESRHIAVVIRSNLRQIVTQQLAVFEILWNRAVPAQDKIREIEDVHQTRENGLGEEKEGSRITIKSPMLSSTVGTATADPVGEIIGQVRTEKGEEEKRREIQNQSTTVTPDAVYDKSSTALPFNRKIQLWSNPSMTEYAIRLDSESGLLETTSEDVASSRYTNFLEEVDYVEDLKYDWKYTLKHWITNRHYHENKSEIADNKKTSAQSFKPKAATSSNMTGIGLRGNKINADDYIGRSVYDSKSTTNQVRYDRLRPFKCHFCKKALASNSRRKKHEQAWHSAHTAK
jgi:hypothetical protein